MSNTRTLELDISKEGAGTCIKVGQGDDGGTTINALIYDNGAEFSLSGATVWLFCRTSATTIAGNAQSAATPPRSRLTNPSFAASPATPTKPTSR